MASFHKYYSKNTKDSRSSKITATQISAILLNNLAILHILWMENIPESDYNG